MMKTVLLPALESALREAGLWRENAVLLLGLSGGGDSVALLHTLALARERVGFTVCVCHVQHGLRGESARQDEAFVRALCRSLAVPLWVTDAGLNATMETPGVETLARDRRRALFLACMEETGAHGLLLAHHLDDQAETVLMRLLRGAGGQGLCGMRPVTPFGRGVAVRPFLGLRKRQLLDALEAAGLAYREDESNRECLTPRNALRNEVMPRLEALYPQAAVHIAQAAEALREDEAQLSAMAEALYQNALCECAGVFALRREQAADTSGDGAALRALRRFYREGLLLRGLAPEERELSRLQSLALLALYRGPAGECLNLPCGLQALSGARYLHLRMQGGEPLRPFVPPTPLALGPWMEQAAGKPLRLRFSGAELELSVIEGDCPAPASAREILAPQELLRSCLLRTPLTGDTLRPFGAPGSKPLRRCLTDRKVDGPFRPGLPVLATGAQALWIPGLCAAEALRAATATGGWRLKLLNEAAYLP